MTRFLISTAALALMSTAGLAADLPVYEPPPAMIAPTPMASNWSGFYVGLHGGYGWADLDDQDTGLVDFDDADLEGAVIGGQIGVNWQWNMFVAGVEADASWSGIDTDDDFDFDGDTDSPGFDWLASARGRVGLAFDRFMIYGTGGVAFTEFDHDGLGTSDDIQVGWVAGGGGEFLVTDNVTLGVEYLHYEFDDTFDTLAGTEVNSDVDVIRGRVNVKFGSLFGG